MTVDRGPPHNAEAERAVLGALLLDPERIDTVAEILKAEHFYEPAHQHVYRAALEIHDANRALDPLILKDHLQGKGLLDEVGGLSLLTDLLDSVATSAHSEAHAGIVREKSELRDLLSISHETIKDVHESSDPSREIVDRAEQRLFSASQNQLGTEGSDVRTVLLQAFELIRRSREEGGINQGISSGYFELDYCLQGFRGAQLVIIAARPSVGKTTFALNLVKNMCVFNGKGGRLFSLEMRAIDITMNLLCSMAKVDSHSLRSGVLSADEESALYDAGEVLSNAPLVIDDSAYLTSMSVRSRSRRQKQSKGLDFIVVDYLQLLTDGGGGHQESRQQEVASISRRLKSLSNELDVPVIALSQLSRKVEDRTDQRPRLADLRESGAIEQDADVVLLIHREDYLKRQQGKKDEEIAPEIRNKAEIIVAKNRNGPTGVAELSFFRESFRFENLARE